MSYINACILRKQRKRERDDEDSETRTIGLEWKILMTPISCQILPTLILLSLDQTSSSSFLKEKILFILFVHSSRSKPIKVLQGNKTYILYIK